MDLDCSREPRKHNVLLNEKRNTAMGGGREALGMLRLSPVGMTKAEQAREVITSGRFDHQSQHVALYVLSIRQNPDGLSMRDLAEGTGWHKSVVRNAALELVEMGFVERAEVFCSYCSSKLSAGATHVDHVQATSLGGADTPENRVPVCRSCNSRKSDKPFLLWLMEIGNAS